MARKPKEINWDIVENQMEAGLTAKQIAHGKIDISNFYGRFKDHFGCDFANYASATYECGDGILKFVQYMKAKSGKTKELEKLCDIRLGQAVLKHDSPPNDEFMAVKHENMLLRAEIEKIKEQMNERRDNGHSANPVPI
jgi:hypothetical protein